MIRRAAALALAAALLVPRGLDGEEPAPPPPPVFTWDEAGALAVADAKGILLAPLHWDGGDWLKFGIAGAAVVGTGFALDHWLRDASQRSRTPGRDDAASAIACFGSVCSFGVLGVFAVVGFAGKNREAMMVAEDGLLASVLAAGIVAPVTKFAVGRARPNAELGSTHFAPFSGDASFPGGHATQAFAVASVISAHSDQWWVSVTAYTIAGLVGFARIYHNAHWTSDVTAGAAIGTFVGRGIVVLNDRLRKGEGKIHVAFAPIVSDQAKGGMLVMDW